MAQGQLNWIANFIWGIADDVLRDVYVRGKYRDVILPMTVLRRLDAVLEPTKQAVLDMKNMLDAAGITNQEAALRQASRQAFYNTSPFVLRDLRNRARAQQLKADFEAYLEGFSSNVQEILEKFKFRNQLPTLIEADILGSLIEKFLDYSINLGPEQSKIFPNAAFGYWKITVERPLRLQVELSAATRTRLKTACVEANEEPLVNIADCLADALGPGPHTDFNAFMSEVEKAADRYGVKLTAKRQKLVQSALAEKDEAAAPVIKKIHRLGRVEPAPLHGRYEVEIDGKRCVVEYESDTELRDTEQVPLLEEGGIEAFFRREVLPHIPDAWIDESVTKIGYEISFTRYFYKPQPLRTLEEIRADIEALERETEGLLGQILVETEGKA